MEAASTIRPAQYPVRLPAVDRIDDRWHLAGIEALHVVWSNDASLLDHGLHLQHTSRPEQGFCLMWMCLLKRLMTPSDFHRALDLLLTAQLASSRRPRIIQGIRCPVSAGCTTGRHVRVNSALELQSSRTWIHVG